METLLRYLRLAVRSLRRTPAFTLTSLLVLGLGIGAATAVFTVLDATVLRPLPYQDADRLYVVHEVQDSGRRIPVNARHFEEWRRSTRSFSEMALIGADTVTLGTTAEPVRVDAARVTPSVFHLLGIQPSLGRAFAAGEDVPGRDGVVMLSHELWSTRFGSDPSVVGRTVLVDGEPSVVIGVLPASFHFPRLSILYPLEAPFGRPELWKPFVPTPRDLRISGSFNHVAVARLRAGVTASQAMADVSTVQAALAASSPDLTVTRAALVPLTQQVAAGTRAGLQLSFAGVGAVLLIACVNITALFLARSSRRHRELAIRQAVGAHHGQLVAQTIAESLVLAAAAGAVGVASGYALVAGIRRFAPIDIPRIDEVAFDARVFGFAAVAALASAAMIGLAPALRAAGVDGLTLLRSSGSTASSSRSARRLRGWLISVEVAASAACLVAAVLLAGSFARLMGVERGFRTDHVVTLELLPPPSYDGAQVARLVATLTARAQAIPGVRAAGATDRLPLSGVSNSAIGLEGTTLPRAQWPNAMVRFSDPGYFDAMGLSLRDGRLLASADADRHVAVVSESAARRLWPGQRAIGQRFRYGGDDAPLTEVVGIVNDVRAVSLREEPPLGIYVPVASGYYGIVSLAVRTTRDPQAVAGELKRLVHSLDPRLAVPAPRTMRQIVDDSVSVARFQMMLVVLLAIAAALLTALGIYGVIAQSVAQRTAEFGVRQAVGAAPFTILRLVLRGALLPVGIGLLAGLVVSVPMGRFMRALLFGISPSDPLSFFTVAGLILFVALAASYVPARRALKVSPVVALRTD